MHLFSSAKPKVAFKKLDQIDDQSLYNQCSGLVSQWFTEEWGYIHDKDKKEDIEEIIEVRKKYLEENASQINLVFYGKILVGAFRVEPREFVDELARIRGPVNEIWFIYVDPACRNLGVGRQIVQEIKRISKEEMPAENILLETLKPGLNRLYQTEGAKWVCDNGIDGNPTDLLEIRPPR